MKLETILFYYPIIQKLHLFFGVEPMLAVFHNGQLGVVLFGKSGDGFIRCEVILAAVENGGRRVPFDRMLAHITEILPRQVLAERGVEDPFFFQVRPL